MPSFFSKFSNVYPTNLAHDLFELHEKNQPIRIGLVGCGEMGTDFLARCALMPGIQVTMIVSRRLEPIFKALKIAYQEDDHGIYVENEKAIQKAFSEKKIAISTDLDLIMKSEIVDIIVDATGYPEAGAQIGYKALFNGKHLVMMNVEADVTIGPYLRFLAQKNNLLYSLGAGDEPSSCMELIEFISAQGHQIVAAGKGKNNPLDINATPDMFEEEAHRRNMNPRMLVEFIDGSKTMVEMAAIANATSLCLDIPGMHGPKADLKDLSNVFIPQEEGGILKKTGIVDYSIGNHISPGVFVVAKMDHPRIWERMEDLKMGKGPYFTFHRPYHLTAMEVPLTCARMALYKRIDMAPLFTPSVEVCAVAKKDLNSGDRLDFIGLYTYRAFSLNYQDAIEKNAVPCGLLENAEIIAPLKKGELITYKNVKPNNSQWIYKLRQEQDKLFLSLKKN